MTPTIFPDDGDFSQLIAQPPVGPAIEPTTAAGWREYLGELFEDDEDVDLDNAAGHVLLLQTGVRAALDRGRRAGRTVPGTVPIMFTRSPTVDTAAARFITDPSNVPPGWEHPFAIDVGVEALRDFSDMPPDATNDEWDFAPEYFEGELRDYLLDTGAEEGRHIVDVANGLWDGMYSTSCTTSVEHHAQDLELWGLEERMTFAAERGAPEVTQRAYRQLHDEAERIRRERHAPGRDIE